MFYVYILQSTTTGSRYVGQTKNFAKRVADHNSGNSRYTKNRGPWKLIYSEYLATRSQAMKRERFLKSGKGRELLKNLGQSVNP